MQTSQPIFSSPIRWTLGVLSWLAFGIAAYLAFTKIMNASVAGCVVGSHSGCDAVLNSAWSTWLFIPVAVLGLNCYALLAGLSVLLLIQSNPNRWVMTAFMLVAMVAAGASLWFIAVQVFFIGDICWYCLTADACGIVIGGLTAWSVHRSWKSASSVRRSSSSSPAFSALRSAIPASSRPAPAGAERSTAQSGEAASPHTAPRKPSAGARTVPLVGAVATSSRGVFAARPYAPVAYGGALALLLLLIGGQIVFPAKTFSVEPGGLNKSVDLSAKNATTQSNDPAPAAEPHVAMRVDTDGGSEPGETKTESNDARPGNGNGASDGADATDEANASTSEPPPEPVQERKISLLGGKLTLDVADEPIIGSPQAPHIVVEMISYDCPHCRKTNRLVKKALSRYRDQVALVVLVLPLDSKCNRLVTDPAASHSGACTTARTAIALAKLNPSLFVRFHEFLMSGDEKKPPALTSILVKSYDLADREKLQALRDSEDVQKKVASYVNLFDALQRESGKGKKEFGLPVQILGNHIMSGSVEKVDDIYKAWEEHLGVKPR